MLGAGIAIEQRKHCSFCMADKVQRFAAVLVRHAQDIHHRFDFRRFDAGEDEAVSAHGALPRAAGEDAQGKFVARPTGEVVIAGVFIIGVVLVIQLTAHLGQFFFGCAELFQLGEPFFCIGIGFICRCRWPDQPPRRFREVFAL